MKSRFLAIAFVVLELSGCGGAAFAPKTATPLAAAAAKTGHGWKTQFIFRYGIPASGPNGKVKSFKIGVYGSKPTHVWDIAKTKSCQAGPECSLVVGLNPVSQFVVESYDGAGGTGHVLSTSIVNRINGYQAVQLMLNQASEGFGALQVAFAPPAPQFGVASRMALVEAAVFGDGTYLVGPAPYKHPVTLHVNGNMSISTTRVAGPGRQVYLSYGGGFESATVTATTNASSSMNNSPPTAVRPLLAASEQRIRVNANQLAVAGDGSVWVSSTIGCALVKVQSDLTTHVYAMPKTLGCPRTMVTGSDGRVWFTSGKGGLDSIGFIGSVTSEGTITGYNIPTGEPASLAAGSDGRLWATERQFGGQIYAMTTDGVLTTAPFKVPNAYGARILAGPDGNLWVVNNENTANGFYVVNTAGNLVQFVRKHINGSTLLAGGKYVYGIINAPRNKKEIGKWDARRKLVATYPISEGSPLVVDPSGALWFNEGGSTLGHLASSGAYCELTMPPSPLPYAPVISSMLATPDGYLYYARGAAVGRIRLKR